jgi:uncharacterized LabA/DUF88 family protein
VSKNVAMFVDVANMYYAARGQDVDVDYVALLKHATKGRDLIRAYAYTGLDPENENQRKFIDFLAKNGYKPVVKDIRKFGDGRMKANLDIELVVDLFRLADRMDIAVIVSGDGDFAPAIRALQDKGVRCEVISFKPNTSSDLVAVADEFMDIMKVASISRKEGRAVRASMSAPEMPAKEVNPEFGFREASPSVAAAALAALKTGVPAASAGNGRRTRGGTGRRAAAAPATVEGEEAAVPASAVETIADGDEQARRRRRRRGGRGRGRSRREDEAVGPEGAPAAEAGEIGWEEFDDLSQLDGADVEVREYGFEEADAATLAELGLSPEELAAMTAAAPGEAEEKPKRRTRARKADADASTDAEEKPKRRTRTRKADANASTDPEEKPRRRSARSKAPASEAPASEAPASEPSADETPAAPKRRSTRAKKDQSAAVAPDQAGASGEPEGIWGRFRSARKPRAGSES